MSWHLLGHLSAPFRDMLTLKLNLKTGVPYELWYGQDLVFWYDGVWHLGGKPLSEARLKQLLTVLENAWVDKNKENNT